MSEMNYFSSKARDLEGKHAGETIFIVGAGPQLASIHHESLERLGSFTTIAVNKVFFRLRHPTYFLSAYIGEVMLAARRIPDSTILHMRPTYEPPLVYRVVPLMRQSFETGMELPRTFGPGAPTLLTKMNVALGATHLAYLLGARRIVFLGVEQRNQLHFYHFDEQARTDIRTAIADRGDPGFLDIDHPYASVGADLAELDRPIEECMDPFFSIDHTPTFKAYFDLLTSQGIDVVATKADSVVADAGARVAELEEILAHLSCDDAVTNGVSP
jgi:hypothetical protein